MLKLTVSCLITLLIASTAVAGSGSSQQSSGIALAISAASTGEHRSADNIARNQYRHPVDTLIFFGLTKDMTVLEIHPGALWYTEILAPVLKANGQLIVAGHDISIEDQPTYRYRQQASMEERLAKEAAIFGDIEIASFTPPQSIGLGQPASVDMVLTFRNFHGWIRDGVASTNLQAFYQVLRPGGVLGVVQHRTDMPALLASGKINGYVSETKMIELAEAAGFILEARSEINANPDDNHDHPEGVWTLPPTLRLGEKNRQSYIEIGESDRMTLRFRKPV